MFRWKKGEIFTCTDRICDRSKFSTISRIFDFPHSFFIFIFFEYEMLYFKKWSPFKRVGKRSHWIRKLKNKQKKVSLIPCRMDDVPRPCDHRHSSQTIGLYGRGVSACLVHADHQSLSVLSMINGFAGELVWLGRPPLFRPSLPAATISCLLFKPFSLSLSLSFSQCVCVCVSNGVTLAVVACHTIHFRFLSSSFRICSFFFDSLSLVRLALWRAPSPHVDLFFSVAIFQITHTRFLPIDTIPIFIHRPFSFILSSSVFRSLNCSSSSCISGLYQAYLSSAVRLNFRFRCLVFILFPALSISISIHNLVISTSSRSEICCAANHIRAKKKKENRHHLQLP